MLCPQKTGYICQVPFMLHFSNDSEPRNCIFSRSQLEEKRVNLGSICRGEKWKRKSERKCYAKQSNICWFCNTELYCDAKWQYYADVLCLAYNEHRLDTTGRMAMENGGHNTAHTVLNYMLRIFNVFSSQFSSPGKKIVFSGEGNRTTFKAYQYDNTGQWIHCKK